jgi:gamma-glutamylcyclotransferase (GGCT)/AIG2-like uncharacterized protein YtfP
MKEDLFSYGTLQKTSIQQKLFGRILNGAKDILCGYRLSPVEIKDESFLEKGEDKYQMTLIPSKDGSVEGTVFEISEEELLSADRYEPENYKRIKVTLQSGKEAWIYVAGAII